MAIGLEMQIRDKRAHFVNPFHTEKGGILSLTSLSGIEYAVYESNPTQDTIPLGLQMHDQEEVDLFRAVPPWRSHRAYPEFTSYPYLTVGVIITNAIHPDIDATTVRAGVPAYLAPSGLITNVTTFNSRKIGIFDSSLNDPTLGVPGILGPSFLRVGGDETIVNPDSVIVNTAGWVRIRIHIR